MTIGYGVFGVARGRISRFPIDLRRRPYNTITLPCECVITLWATVSAPAVSEAVSCSPPLSDYVCGVYSINKSDRDIKKLLFSLLVAESITQC